MLKSVELILKTHYHFSDCEWAAFVPPLTTPKWKLAIDCKESYINVNFDEEGSNTRMPQDEVYAKLLKYVREVASK